MRLRSLCALALVGGLSVAGALAAGCGGSEPSTSGGGGSGGDGDKNVLFWGAIPDAKGDDLATAYEPVSAYLSQELGVPVQFKKIDTYDGLVQAFSAGDVQLAWFGGLTGVQAWNKVPGSRAIAQGVEDPEYKSYFVAHPSTGIKPSDTFPLAMADFPFAFGSESSTSGRLMPEYFIRKETGKAPKDFFAKGFTFSGTHDKTALLVAEGGAVKCGALSYRKWDTMVAKGELDPEQCPIVWTTPVYADYNFTAHPVLETRFGAGFTDKLQKALIGMDAPKLVEGFLRTRFIAAKNEDFAAIAEVARELGLLR